MSNEMRDEFEEFDTFDSQLGCGKNKTQLDLYLEEPNLDRKVNSDLDVLAYWKENRLSYPELSLMARDVLSIPITTVASESTFSIGGRIIEKYTSSILRANAEAKLCTRDWLCGQEASLNVFSRKWRSAEMKKEVARSTTMAVYLCLY